MNKTNHPFIQKSDLLLLAGIFVFALILLLLFSFFTGGKGTTVDITIDGKPYCSLPLAEDCELSVHGISGDNQIRICNGLVSVTAADCPDLICVHHTPISSTGERIVCLPNRVVVSISRTTVETAPDAVSQ